MSPGRWPTLALAIALALALLPGAALAQAAPVEVPAGTVVPGDLATFAQPIVVWGVVEGDVTSWGGDIFVAGTVHGDVVSYTGKVALAPAARVGGSVLALAGGLVHEPGALVAGAQLGAEPLPSGVVLASVAAIFDPPGAANAELPRPLLSGALGLVAGLLTLAGTIVWPRRTQGVSLALRRLPGRSLGLGLLTTGLLAPLLVVLASLLALSLIGLPLILPLLLALQLPYLLGLAGLAQALGARLAADRPPPLVATAFGLLAIMPPLMIIGALAPLWSAALFYLAASAGLGAAILSRGGAYRL